LASSSAEGRGGSEGEEVSDGGVSETAVVGDAELESADGSEGASEEELDVHPVDSTPTTARVATRNTRLSETVRVKAAEVQW
jgi:hypothetical protein